MNYARTPTEEIRSPYQSSANHRTSNLPSHLKPTLEMNRNHIPVSFKNSSNPGNLFFSNLATAFFIPSLSSRRLSFYYQTTYCHTVLISCFLNISQYSHHEEEKKELPSIPILKNSIRNEPKLPSSLNRNLKYRSD